MASKQAYKRLTREYKLIVENPPPYIVARPNEDNILEWHYVITGPPDTPYENGQYHGTLTFPSDYPYKPPAIRMVTPNGRFKENTRLCLSMSDYHPDLWNPGWSVATILTGLLSFMTGDEATTGSINTTEAHKRLLAKRSIEFNTFSNKRFKAVFPDIVEKNFKLINMERQRQQQEREEQQKASIVDTNGGLVQMVHRETSTSNDPIAKAAREKTVALEEIEDPEDRIRAEEVLRALGKDAGKEQQQHQKKKKEGYSQMYYIVFAVCLFVLGLFMK